MEFWGIEIKPGAPVKVHVKKDEYIIHVSQVTLGESSKVKDETVPVYVTVGKDKSRFVIGNLSQKFPQVFLDLILEQDFELSHNCKTSSVYLLGYKSLGEEDDEHNSDSDFDSEEEDIYMDNELANAPAPVLNDQKAIEAAESDSDEEDESDSDDEMDSDEDEDDDDSEEEEVEEDKAPLKVEPPSKKQPNGGAMKQKAKHGPGCCVPPKAGRQ